MTTKLPDIDSFFLNVTDYDAYVDQTYTAPKYSIDKYPEFRTVATRTYATNQLHVYAYEADPVTGPIKMIKKDANEFTAPKPQYTPEELLPPDPLADDVSPDTEGAGELFWF